MNRYSVIPSAVVRICPSDESESTIVASAASVAAAVVLPPASAAVVAAVAGAPLEESSESEQAANPMRAAAVNRMREVFMPIPTTQTADWIARDGNFAPRNPNRSFVRSVLTW